ncbi:hypothetical protein quinque_000247 [Culex quinquefasciatus]
MPKTVPKSSNDDHQYRNLASVPRGGGTLNAKRKHSELEPNGEAPETSVNEGADEDRARSNYLVEALRRIQELQDEIEFLENDPYAEDADSEDESDEYYGQDHAGASVIVGHQAEALGFAVCARETMAFLEREGVPRDAPMMVNLRARLIGERN